MPNTHGLVARRLAASPRVLRCPESIASRPGDRCIVILSFIRVLACSCSRPLDGPSFDTRVLVPVVPLMWNAWRSLVLIISLPNRKSCIMQCAMRPGQDDLSSGGWTAEADTPQCITCTPTVCHRAIPSRPGSQRLPPVHKDRAPSSLCFHDAPISSSSRAFSVPHHLSIIVRALSDALKIVSRHIVAHELRVQSPHSSMVSAFSPFAPVFVRESVLRLFRQFQSTIHPSLTYRNNGLCKSVSTTRNYDGDRIGRVWTKLTGKSLG